MERGLEDMSSILKVEDLVKYYGEGENQVRAVDHTSLQIERGKFTAIVGRSGSGKSTLLHLLGGLEQATDGSIKYGDTDFSKMSQNQIRRIPVCDCNNHVVGILTLGDLAQNDKELGKQEVCTTISNICNCGTQTKNDQ